MNNSNKNYNRTIVAAYIGYITQAIVNNFPTLLFVIFSETFSIPLLDMTVLITLNFTLQLCVDFLAARYIDKIGYRVGIVSAHIFSASGMIGLAVFPFVLPEPFWGLVLSVVLYALGGGLLEVLVSPIVEACPTDNKASVMSLLHSFYCWGTVAVILFTTAFFALFGKENWRVIAFLWALVPICNAVFFTRVPLATLTDDGEGMTLPEMLKNKFFWIFVILMVASGASEQGMSQWASAFAEKGLGVSKAIGDLAGPCMFSIFMGSARVFYAKMSEKVDLLSFIMFSSALCVVSYLTASLAGSPILSLIGCGLCGLSVGIMWPGVFSIASARFPKGGTAMFAYLALAGDLGCMSGPSVVGAVASAVGDNLKKGLAVGIVFPILLISVALVYRILGKTAKTK